MKACVFVDGENFRFSINRIFESLFNKTDYLPKNARWADFFDHIVSQSSGKAANRLRAYWYVVAEVDVWPELPKHNTPDEISNWHTKNAVPIQKYSRLKEMTYSDIDELKLWKSRTENRFGGFRKIQRGIENKHNAIEFRRSGTISYNLFNKSLAEEKTVDVNLAVDMLQMRDAYDIAIIVSGDQDYLPAVQAIKNAGKTVVNVVFTYKSGKMLPGGARRLNEATDRSLIIDYKTFAHYLNIPIPQKATGK